MDALVTWLGLKKLVLIAGLLGGAFSAGLLPGPLAALSEAWKRMLCGSFFGAMAAGFGAEPLAAELGKPDYLNGIAVGLGLFGLSIVFKLLKAWNDFDLSGVLGRLGDKIIERIGGK